MTSNSHLPKTCESVRSMRPKLHCWPPETDYDRGTQRRINSRTLATSVSTVLQTLIVWATESLQYDSLLCDFVHRFKQWLATYETTLLKCYTQSVMSLKWRLPKHKVNFFIVEVEYAIELLRQENGKIVALLEQNINDYLLCQSANFRRRVYNVVDNTLVSLQNEMQLFTVTLSHDTSGKFQRRHAELVRSLRQLHDWPVPRKQVLSFRRQLLMSTPKTAGSQLGMRSKDIDCPANYGTIDVSTLAPLFIREETNQTLADPLVLPTLSGGKRAALWSAPGGTFSRALRAAFYGNPDTVSFGVHEKVLCIQKLTLVNGSRDNCHSTPDTHLGLLTNSKYSMPWSSRRQASRRYRRRRRSGYIGLQDEEPYDVDKGKISLEWRDAAINYMTLFYNFVSMYTKQVRTHWVGNSGKQRQNVPGERSNWAEPHLMDDNLIESNYCSEHMESYASWAVTSSTSRARLRAIANLYPPTARVFRKEPLVQHTSSYDSEQKIVSQLVNLVTATCRQRNEVLHKLFSRVVTTVWRDEIQKMGLSPNEIGLLTYPLTPVIAVAAMLPVYVMLSNGGAFLFDAEESKDSDDVDGKGDGAAIGNEELMSETNIRDKNDIAGRNIKSAIYTTSTVAEATGGGAFSNEDSNAVPDSPLGAGVSTCFQKSTKTGISRSSSSCSSSSSNSSSGSSTNSPTPHSNDRTASSTASSPHAVSDEQATSSKLESPHGHQSVCQSHKTRNNRKQAIFMWSGIGLLALGLSQSNTTLTKFRNFLHSVITHPSTVADYYTGQRQNFSPEWTRCYFRSVYNPLWWSNWMPDSKVSNPHHVDRDGGNEEKDDHKFDDHVVKISRLYRQQVAYIVSQFPDSV